MRLLVGSIAIVAMTAAIFAACGDSSFDANVAADAAAGDAPVDASSLEASRPDAASNDGGPCASSRGPLMIQVPTTPTYCIDFTEVTRAQYDSFIDAVAHGYSPPADPRCSWNKNYNPSPGCVASLGDAGDAGDAGADFPVTCIDWCDALSYCGWAGKSLCGRIESTEPLTLAEATDKAVSQWENACNANGTRTFPYGSSYIDGGCNLHKSSGADAITDTASPAYAQCVGGYSDIHDMAGNAAEWVNACNDVDASDASSSNCVIMGGSFGHSLLLPPGRCDDHGYTQRQAQLADVGFRCCSN